MPFDKDRLPDPVSYYIEQLVKLKVKGARGQALCPFHNEKTPSFSVNLLTGGFHCFGCGEHGSDILWFHRQRYGLSFKDAARELGAWK